MADTIDAIGRYLALVRQRAGAAEARLAHQARSEAETAVASLRATIGQLGLEPGSGTVVIVGEVSAAAARVLDTIIALPVMLDLAGPGQPAGITTAIIGDAGDALTRMRAAIAGQEPPAPAAALADTRHPPALLSAALGPADRRRRRPASRPRAAPCRQRSAGRRR